MSYSTFIFTVQLLQLVAGAWLVTRGRKIGFFFALVAVGSMVSMTTK